MKSVSKTKEVYFLIIAVVVQAIAAIYGGLNLIIDPTGISIKLPLVLLRGTFFANFLFPGILLLVLLGLFPLFLIYPLVSKPRWPQFNKLNLYKGYHWVWTYTLYNSIIVISWINIQLMIIGQGSMMQGIVGFWGTIILILTLTPSVKRFYRSQQRKKYPEFAEKQSEE